MISRTLGQLRAQVRQRCDLENSAFVSDSFVTDAVNFAARDLFALLIQAYGDGHFEGVHTINTVAGTRSYALPSDFYRLIGLTVAVGGQEFEVVPQRATDDEMTRSLVNDARWLSGVRVGYQLRGRNLVFSPTPSGVHSVTMRYVSTALFFQATTDAAVSELSADGDYVSLEDMLWLDYVITHAAIRCARKEEADTADLERDMGRVASRISDLAGQRDMGAAQRVRMVM